MGRTPTTAQVRWMIRRDMPEVMDIENSSEKYPWLEEDFLQCLRQRNCIGMVLIVKERVLGYMTYELFNTRLHILKLAVHPKHRRKGYGSQLVDKLIWKLSQQRRNELTAVLRESNVEGQIFLRANKFEAIRTIAERFEDTGEDGYLMRIMLPKEAIANYWAQNRVSQYFD